MRNHDHHVAALASGQPVDQFMDTPEPPTPVKDKPIARQAPRRPNVPLKNDNSVSHSKSITNVLLTIFPKAQQVPDESFKHSHPQMPEVSCPQEEG